jgi:hypothetical protein
MDREPLTGQCKWEMDTREFHVVPSEATETPNLERQGNLLGWGEDMKRLEEWKRQVGHR